jgi:hypothetical protein
LRDLFIGIILNLCCNVENLNLILRLIKEHEIIGILARIMVDSRHDWPTNGAALALIQYSYKAMNETEIFSFMDKCNLKETT